MKPDFRFSFSEPALPAIRKILLHLLNIMEHNLDGIRKDINPEFLHDFRVAVRRTRSALGQFKDVLPATVVTRFVPDFAWLGTVTGAPRDLDVYLLKFPHYRNSLPADLRHDLRPLHEFLREKREEAHRNLIEALDSPRCRQLIEEWRRWLESSLKTNVDSQPLACRSIREVADERIGRMFRQTLKKGRRITVQSPAENLHELRKTCKKLRYLLEFFRSLYPHRKINLLIELLKKFQENLGTFQDLEVQSQTLRQFGIQMSEQAPLPPETLLAMGMLVENLRVKQREVRDEFANHFDEFATSQNLRLEKELFRQK